MTLEELYKKGTTELQSEGIENPSVDAFYLLEHAAGLNRTRYLMFKDQQVSDSNINQYMQLIETRKKHIPYQYIIGRAEFAGLTYEVNTDVLIPRLDTEVLFEQTLHTLGYRAYVLDLCTGSGALGISLKRYRPDIHVVLSDISSEALEVAGRNIEHQHMHVAEPMNKAAAREDIEYGYDLNMNIRIIKSDLFDQMTPEGTYTYKKKSKLSLVGKFDVIVSNPPYVTEKEYSNLMPEVRNYEPKLALTAGEDGLDFYRRIAADAPSFLKDGGKLLLEIGSAQAEPVRAILSENGFTDIEIIKDLADLDRVIKCTNTCHS